MSGGGMPGGGHARVRDSGGVVSEAVAECG